MDTFAAESVWGTLPMEQQTSAIPWPHAAFCPGRRSRGRKPDRSARHAGQSMESYRQVLNGKFFQKKEIL